MNYIRLYRSHTHTLKFLELIIFMYIDHTHTRIHTYTLENRASQVVLVVRNLPASAEDIRDEGSVCGLERSPGGGHGPVFLPREFQGQRNLAGYSPWWSQRVGHY